MWLLFKMYFKNFIYSSLTAWIISLHLSVLALIFFLCFLNQSSLLFYTLLEIDTELFASASQLGNHLASHLFRIFLPLEAFLLMLLIPPLFWNDLQEDVFGGRFELITASPYTLSEIFQAKQVASFAGITYFLATTLPFYFVFNLFGLERGEILFSLLFLWFFAIFCTQAGLYFSLPLKHSFGQAYTVFLILHFFLLLLLVALDVLISREVRQWGGLFFYALAALLYLKLQNLALERHPLWWL
jgi:hypothetical protein